jgi:predicted DNA-binding protein
VAIGKGRAATISVRLSAEECERARRLAQETGRTISGLARYALRRYMERRADD